VQYMVTELSEVSEVGIETAPALDTEVRSILAQYVEDQFVRVDAHGLARTAAPVNKADDDDDLEDDDFEDDDFEDDDLDDEDFEDDDFEDDDLEDDDFDDDEEFEG